LGMVLLAIMGKAVQCDSLGRQQLKSEPKVCVRQCSRNNQTALYIRFGLATLRLRDSSKSANPDGRRDRKIQTCPRSRLKSVNLSQPFFTGSAMDSHFKSRHHRIHDSFSLSDSVTCLIVRDGRFTRKDQDSILCDFGSSSLGLSNATHWKKPALGILTLEIVHLDSVKPISSDLLLEITSDGFFNLECKARADLNPECRSVWRKRQIQMRRLLFSIPKNCSFCPAAETEVKIAVNNLLFIGQSQTSSFHWYHRTLIKQIGSIFSDVNSMAMPMP
jgi:hypothetical protein